MVRFFPEQQLARGEGDGPGDAGLEVHGAEARIALLIK
jgi:hypothetical protein